MGDGEAEPGRRVKRWDESYSYSSYSYESPGCTVVRDYAAIQALIVIFFLLLTAAQIGSLVLVIYRRCQRSSNTNANTNANSSTIASGGEVPQAADATQAHATKDPRFMMACLYYAAFFPWLIYTIVGMFFCLSEWMNASGLFAFIIIGGLWLIFIPILLLLESCFSSERQYISNLGSSSNVEQQVERFVLAPPIITMVATGYHTVTTTHTSTDSRGRTTHRTETRRVVSRVEKKAFAYSHWHNQTTPDASVLRTTAGITKVKGKLIIEWGDTETGAEFDRQFAHFKDMYRNIDVSVDFTVEKTVSGFEARLTSVQPGSSALGWVNMNQFLCYTMLLLGWCYRYRFRKVTGKLEYLLVKHVFLQGSPAPIGFEPYIPASGYSVVQDPGSLEALSSSMAAAPPHYEEAVQLAPFLPSSDGELSACKY